MTDNELFCTKCGNKVPADAQYCQKCGEPIAGSDAEAQRKQMYQDYETMMKEGRMTWLMFLLVIYAIPAMVLAIWAIFDIEAITNSIFYNVDFQQWFASHPEVTIDTVRSYVTYMTYMVLGSGVCACISLFCVIKRNWWMVAVVTCFIAAFLCIGSIFGILVGFLVAWMIYSARDSFVDQQNNA